ncbi:MAG: LuxR C-terminal-related transcriptional regulator, partial [Actinomycetota bacterium]|nr:LuxR C-terminal-related transcriptional regulator [Actinomycetota bacterium]
QELYISDTTVKTHITHILQKLNVVTVSKQSCSRIRPDSSRGTRSGRPVATRARLADLQGDDWGRTRGGDPGSTVLHELALTSIGEPWLADLAMTAP